MKKRVLYLALVLAIVNSFAQQSINYKAVISNNGTVIQNQAIQVQFTILENGTTNVYQETSNPTTNENGIVVLNIGEGTVVNGNFLTINWRNEQFLKVEIDTGSGYTNMGTTAFGFVPYAKNANNSETFEGKTLAEIKAEIKAEIASEYLNGMNLNIAANYNDLHDAGGILNYKFNLLDVRTDALETKTESISIETINGYETVRFTHVNLQVVSGSGSTNSRYSSNNLVDGRGLGNIIIGYNERNNGGALDSKDGYHNLVSGIRNSYNSYGGLVAGDNNVINAPYATVTGGNYNRAESLSSSVSGGFNRTIDSGNNFSWKAGSLNESN